MFPMNDLLMRLRQMNMYRPVAGPPMMQSGQQYGGYQPPIPFEGYGGGGLKGGGRFPALPNPLNALNGLNRFGAFYGQRSGPARIGRNY